MNWPRLILFVSLLVWTCPSALAAEKECPGPGCPAVKGDLFKKEGEFYVIRDFAGNKVRVRVDKSTRLEGTINIGDRIEALVTEEGYAVSIRPLK